MAGSAHLIPGTGAQSGALGRAAIIKAKVEARLPPASACLSDPLLQGTLAGTPGSSKEGLDAREATSWASPPMQLKDRVVWGGTVGSQMYDNEGRKKIKN